MKLFQKGVLLLAIPIVGQFASVLFLVGTYRNAEELAWKDAHYRAQTQELMSLSVYLYRGIALLTAYGANPNESFLNVFDRQYDQLEKKVELLTILEKEDASPAGEAAIKTLRTTLADLYKARQLVKMRGKLLTNSVMIDEFKGHIGDSLAVIEQLIAERSVAGAQSVHKLESSRTMFLVSVITGFAFNMLIAAGLLFLFAKDFASRFAVIVDNAKKVGGGAALGRPVSGRDELAELDAVLHRANEQLLEAEARKQQFLSMLTHDMRTPLSAVQLNLELASKNVFGDVPEEARERLAESEKLTRRLSRLINDILDFDKLRAGKTASQVTVVDVKALVGECVNELSPIAERAHVGLISRVKSDVHVVANEEDTTRVLINLMSNALKFSPAGSDVIVEAAAEEAAGADAVRVSVRDRGPGIPAEFREKIFLPFEQVPDAKPVSKAASSGLGLAICKMLVESAGGHIGVEAPTDGGSLFWFTLPAAVLEEV